MILDPDPDTDLDLDRGYADWPINAENGLSYILKIKIKMIKYIVYLRNLSRMHNTS